MALRCAKSNSALCSVYLCHAVYSYIHCVCYPKLAEILSTINVLQKRFTEPANVEEQDPCLTHLKGLIIIFWNLTLDLRILRKHNRAVFSRNLVFMRAKKIFFAKIFKNKSHFGAHKFFLKFYLNASIQKTNICAMVKF